VDARHLLAVEVAAYLDRELVVAADAGERDGFGYYVVCRELVALRRPPGWYGRRVLSET
jgi:hypothetical protein